MVGPWPTWSISVRQALLFGTGVGTLQNLNGCIDLGAIDLYGFLGLDDSGDVVGRIATLDVDNDLDFATIDGLAPVTIKFAPSGLSELSIVGGSGGNVFGLNNLPAGITTTLYAGEGTDSVTVAAVPADATLDLFFQGGGDSFTLGAGNLDAIAGLVNLDADAPINLSLDDSLDVTSDSVTLTATAIAGLGGSTVTFTEGSLASLTISAGQGGNTFQVNGVPGRYRDPHQRRERQ